MGFVANHPETAAEFRESLTFGLRLQAIKDAHVSAEFDGARNKEQNFFFRTVHRWECIRHWFFFDAEFDANVRNTTGTYGIHRRPDSLHGRAGGRGGFWGTGNWSPVARGGFPGAGKWQPGGRGPIPGCGNGRAAERVMIPGAGFVLPGDR